MLNQQIEIINKLGLHARAAAKFVTTATRFSSEIHILLNGTRVNGKSIMGIMMLAAAKGTTLEIEISGTDQEDAMDALILLINNRFDEDC